MNVERIPRGITNLLVIRVGTIRVEHQALAHQSAKMGTGLSRIDEDRETHQDVPNVLPGEPFEGGGAFGAILSPFTCCNMSRPSARIIGRPPKDSLLSFWGPSDRAGSPIRLSRRAGSPLSMRAASPTRKAGSNRAASPAFSESSFASSIGDPMQRSSPMHWT